jgi:peptidyl-prolyl cis-trans isomerase SurA
MTLTPWAVILLMAPVAIQAQQPSPAAPPPVSAVPIEITKPQVDTINRIVAIVGNTAITLSDLIGAVNEQRAQGRVLPTDPQGQMEVASQVLGDLVDQEILVQQAKDRGDTVADQDVASTVDRQIRGVRSHFQSDAEYKTELKNAGFGTPEEYKRSLSEQVRRHMLQQKAFADLSKGARPASVTEEEVNHAYEQARTDLQKRPATITFRQIVVTPKPSKEEDAKAHAKADSILVQLQHGADFEELAKRESMDPGSAKLGGDLGWNRRGSGFVPEFEAMMFAIAPGHLSPVFKTTFGYHILRVDRVQPAEVKVRHILIAPTIDSNDVHGAFLKADSIAARWRKGATFDSLVAKYHDTGEEKGILQPYPIDSLPESYRTAIADLQAGQITEPFTLKSQNGTVKYTVLQIVTRTAPGEYSLPEIRETIREQLQQEKQTREILDKLRKQTYVSIRL